MREKEVNLLILSAGRRVELIKCFRNAARELGIQGKIIAADASYLAPALYFADKWYLLPPIGSRDYLGTLIQICDREKITLVVPTIDTELSVLAKNKQRIEKETGAAVLVSDPEVIEICRDKVKSQAFLEKNGFKVPGRIKEADYKKVKFPVFIKPADGSSSVQAFKVRNQKELEFFSKYVENPLVQEFAEGEEYTVDVFLDFQSRPITIVPRARIATRGGEILKGKIVKDYGIMKDVAKLMEALKPTGPITVQCIKGFGELQYIEINPRFGGGAPMSIMAGADSCKNLYRICLGEKLSYQENYRENSIFLRFDASVELRDGGQRP